MIDKIQPKTTDLGPRAPLRTGGALEWYAVSVPLTASVVLLFVKDPVLRHE